MMSEEKAQQKDSQETIAPHQMVQQPVSVPEITAGDLQLMVKVIDLGSRRGAFLSNELSTVGGLNDRLNAYLNYIEKQPPAAKAEKASE